MTTPFLSANEVGTAGARTLGGEFYTSREIFERERERIFSRRWVCVGREQQLAGGGYFLRDVAGESLILLRDQAGQVRAHYNVCRHRGSRLCEEASGRLAATIQCPYHAWTYALDGRLLGAPGMEALAGFDKSAHGLAAAAAGVWEGFLFVSLAQQPEPLEQAFAALAGKFARYELPRLASVRRIDYDVRANWKLIVQNYSECYHCPGVHPQLVKLSPADSGKNDLTSGPFLGGYMSLPAGAALTKSGRRCAIDVGPLTDEDRQRVYYYSIFPNLLLSLHADYVMVHTLWPLAPDRTRVECEWLFSPDAAGRNGFDPDGGVQFWDETNRQDWHVCELSQQGVGSRAYRPGLYSPRESISAAFDREVLRALAE
ncbi:MAG TPA: aromatic ring-hydroxylating dioxygenase subunit alpha [Pirellulaceae bacterium]|nr:aromatic ring-hydroxylating dioxygenase subunit alpha [Pirellulaceae bacterium]